jgi:NTP pyrophosphatase (non-canonical NTP hydrolase)
MIDTFEAYQKRSRALAFYPDIGNNYMYPILGLFGESGEVCEKIKKIIRDKNGVFTDGDRVALMKECGDVLWYLTQLSVELGFSLHDVAIANIEKLEGRHQRGTLQGSGDDR